MEDLDKTVKNIVKDGKTPVIFFLIGCAPSYSSQHQSPPFIFELLNKNNNDLVPLVIAVDPLYDSERIKELQFLNKSKDEEIPIVNQWYYPDQGQNQSEQYHQKVGYLYRTEYITESSLKKIIDNVYEVDDGRAIILLWQFTGHQFFKEHNYDTSRFHNPPSNCSANVETNGEYYPNIMMDNKGKYFIDYTGHTLKNYLERFQKACLLKENSKRYCDNFKHLLKDLREEFQVYRSWENSIRLKDPKMKICFNRDSSDEEWEHFQYRAGYYFNIQKLKKQFMESGHQYLKDYLNDFIQDMSYNTILFKHYLKKYNEKDKVSDIDLEEEMGFFMDEHLKLVEDDSTKLPSILTSFSLTKLSF